MTLLLAACPRCRGDVEYVVLERVLKCIQCSRWWLWELVKAEVRAA